MTLKRNKFKGSFISLFPLVIIAIILSWSRFTKSLLLLFHANQYYFSEVLDNNLIIDNISRHILRTPFDMILSQKIQMNPCTCNLYKKPLNGSNSKPNDIVVTLLFQKIFNSLIFLKTLRTKSKAAIIFFVNNESYNKIYNYKCFYNMESICNVYFYRITSYTITQKDFLRHYILRNFLLERQDIIDRVIICDAFDTVFQDDPFTNEINWDSIGFTQENITVLEDKVCNYPWLLAIYDFFKIPFNESKYHNWHAVCSGVLFGKTQNILQFYKYFFSPKIMENINTLSITDQGYFNYRGRRAGRRKNFARHARVEKNFGRGAG